MRTALAAGVAGLALTLAAGAAQDRPGPPVEPQATFRTGVEFIHLDVSVLDRQRMPVRGLTREDFTVLDEGVPQTIEAFSAVDLPDVVTMGAAWRRSVAPDVVSNGFDAQRVVVILMDDYAVPFDPGVTKIARTIAHAVIDRLGPADLGAVVYTLGRNQGQEFTTSRTRLADAVDRFLPSGLKPTMPNRFHASTPNQPSIAMGNGTPSGACLGGRCLTEALEKVGEALQAWPGGRKTLVFISPAMTLSPAVLEDPRLRDELGSAIAAMQRANLTVYQFDPRGLETGRNPNDDFDIFSDSTGGRAVHDTNTPWEMVPQVFRENSSYYLLAFRSTSQRRDGRFHKLTVKVARADVEVRTRSGYLARPLDRAPKPSKKPEPTSLERAISGALPTGDVPLSLTAAPFARPGRKEAALVVVAGLERGAEAPASEVVELDMVAFDGQWKPAQAFHQTIELKRPADADAEMHIDLGSRIDLAPGRYEVRVAARSLASDRAGSVYTSVTVPDYTKAPLSLSGVVLQREPASPANALVSEVVPIVPTTVREFASGDRVTGFFRIYQGGRQAIAPVQLTMRIVDEDDRTLLSETAVVDVAAFGTSRSAERRFTLPLSRLQPGEYLLSFAATSGDRPAVERALTFRVR